MVLKSYQEYILESILLTSDKFKNIISKVDDKISRDLISLIGTEVKTNFNIINTTDKNDTVSFFPDNQASNKIKSGINPEDLFKIENPNRSTVGRVVKNILNANGIKTEPRDIEKFVDGFKSEYEKSLIVEEKSPFKIVEGEEIRSWYLWNKYCDDTIEKSKGTLGKSCMRYDDTQEYLDIYTKNIGIVSLVIMLDDDNKLRSRALLWITENKTIYLDRIYYTQSHESSLMTDWVKQKYPNLESFSNSPKLSVDLKIKGVYSQYPYMDSFIYYDSHEGKLFNYEPGLDRKNLYLLQETNGEALNQDTIEDINGDFIPREDAIYSDYHRGYISSYNSQWSKFHNSYIDGSGSVYSDIIQDYIYEDEVVTVYKDINASTFTYYPKDFKTEDYGRDTLSGYNYLMKLLVNINNRYYVKERIVHLYKVDESSRDEYFKIYNSRYNRCVKEDVEIFGFKLVEGLDKISDCYSYYESMYLNVIYTIMLEKIKKSGASKQSIDFKINELNKANDYLIGKYYSFYKMNNKIYEKYGGVENLEKWFKTFHDKIDELSKGILEDSDIEYRFSISNEYAFKIQSLILKLCKEKPVIFFNGIYSISSSNMDYIKSQFKELKLPKDVNVDSLLRFSIGIGSSIFRSLNLYFKTSDSSEIDNFFYYSYYLKNVNNDAYIFC